MAIRFSVCVTTIHTVGAVTLGEHGRGGFTS
jgi:hypothetical protein